MLNFIQMAIRGLFAVYWYKKESERRIHRVYDRCPEGPQRSDALAATGGTSWAAVFIYLGVLHRSRGSGIFPDGTGPERRNPVFDDVKI